MYSATDINGEGLGPCRAGGDFFHVLEIARTEFTEVYELPCTVFWRFGVAHAACICPFWQGCQTDVSHYKDYWMVLHAQCLVANGNWGVTMRRMEDGREPSYERL